MVTRHDSSADETAQSKPDGGNGSAGDRQAEESAGSVADEAATAAKPAEVGGRKGPDPTRYGDWEKGGRCIDF